MFFKFRSAAAQPEGRARISPGIYFQPQCQAQPREQAYCCLTSKAQPNIPTASSMEKRKLILRNFLSPGDLVMLTAAVRDLHRSHPGEFLTDVRTSCPELWQYNPHLTPLRETEEGVQQIDCHYPLIDRSNEAPYHCIHGFADDLNSQLKLNIRPTVFAGDIHLSANERRWKSTIHELGGRDIPFWIINAGGKFDYTIKWWDWRRYQQVVDYFRGKILFVQIGEIGHYHPPLKDVVDLRGRTDLRQLVRLVYHAQGVLCGVTALMHLAAAVPTRPDRSTSRAAVIIAGGREPTHWEAYSPHQYIHTIGALPCCDKGGCWRARTVSLGDGEKHDEPNNICSNVVGELPRCMDMITAGEVIQRIERYFVGGMNRFLTATEARSARRAITKSVKGPRLDDTINLLTAPAALEKKARELLAVEPPALHGHGILLFANHPKELAGAIASAHSVRALDPSIPVECWLAPSCSKRAAAPFRALRVNVCVTVASNDQQTFTHSELRLHALQHSRMREVIVIAPGVLLQMPPRKLFTLRPFRTAGALFPNRGEFRARPGVWKLCRLRAPASAAGNHCIVLDRQRAWAALSLWRWIVDKNYFFSGYVDGDGGAAQLAFARLGHRLSLSMPPNAFAIVPSVQ
jgi:hypothetical protein